MKTATSEKNVARKHVYSKLEMAVFWVVEPCSLVQVYQRFEGVSCLFRQGCLVFLSLFGCIRVQYFVATTLLYNLRFSVKVILTIVLIKHRSIKTYATVAPLFLDLVIRWRSLVSITPLPF
jgi:hypothetical protein